MNLLEELRGLLKRADEDWYLTPFEQPIGRAIAEIERLTTQIEQMHEAQRDRARSYAETYQRNSGGLKTPS